ncbi:hypothetical protein EU534_01510 [Candidatus Heimdallarchaeota archaeon]|nr:MAG: hypothetical protein EU534_01510 [Candidatus Heimdallarchaeota archaeon]
MTVDKVDNLAEKISFLEKKINRIEQMLQFLIDEEELTEEDKMLIKQVDEVVENDRLDELIRVK